MTFRSPRPINSVPGHVCLLPLRIPTSLLTVSQHQDTSSYKPVKMLCLAAALVAGLQLAAAFVVDGKQKPLGFEPKPKGTTAKAKTQPNIIFILTDDQDLRLQSLDYLPLIKKHLADEGTTYKRHYCTTAICCPARVSLWTGKQAHNTNVTDVSPPYGKQSLNNLDRIIS